MVNILNRREAAKKNSFISVFHVFLLYNKIELLFTQKTLRITFETLRITFETLGITYETLFSSSPSLWHKLYN